MSRKTHVTGFRLNITQPSAWQVQCYGRTPNAYASIVVKLRKLFMVMERNFSKNMINLGSLELIIKNNLLFSNVFYTSYGSPQKSTRLHWIAKTNAKDDSVVKRLVLKEAISLWMLNDIKIRFYRVHWLYNPRTLISWMSKQLEQQNSIKVVLSLLKKELAKNTKQQHVTKSFVTGDVKFFLAGIKIICRGRLRGKRQRMSNQLVKQLGVMPLQTLDAFIEYENKSLYTRFGKVGIHVYYYYCKTQNV